MSSSKTIRLQNTGLTNLSLHLYQLRPAAHGAMKKGPTLTPILIAAGRYYDVCSELGCSFEDAQKICDRSPEVRAFENSGRLARIIFPPPMPVGQPAEMFALPPAVVVSGVDVSKDVISVEVTPPPAPAPAPEPVLTPEAVDAEHAFLVRAATGEPPAPAPTPDPEPEPELKYDVFLSGIGSDQISVVRELRNALGLSLTEAKALLDAAPRAVFTGPKDAADALAATLAAHGASVEVVLEGMTPTAPARAVRRGEPSMDWAEDELRFYAEAHGIDISKAKSKTAILRAIRSAK